MSWREAAMREDAAFAELVRAVEHRKRIDAKMAVYNEHREGYDAALADLEAAVQAYGLVLEELRRERAGANDPA